MAGFGLALPALPSEGQNPHIYLKWRLSPESPRYQLLKYKKLGEVNVEGKELEAGRQLKGWSISLTHRGPESVPGIARAPEPGVMSDHPEPDNKF